MIVKLFYNQKIRQTFVLTAARFAGIALGFAVSIINTRFLNTEDYGKLKFIQQIFIILPILLGFGFSYSGGRLLACKEYEDRNEGLLRASNLIFGILSLCATVLILLFSLFVDRIFETSVQQLLICMSPFAFVFFFRISVTNLLQGLNHIYLFSIWQIAPQFLYVLLVYICVWKFHFSLSIALFSNAAIGTLITLAWIYRIYQGSWNFNSSDIKLILNENKTNGFHVYLGSLSGVLIGQLIPVFVGYFSDMESVGYYGLALTMSTPLMFIPTTIGTVMFKSFANRAEISMKILLIGVFSSIFAYLMFFVAIKYLVEFVYPPDYLKTVLMARVLGLGMVCHGLGDIFNRFLGSHGQGKKLRNSAFIVGLVIILVSLTTMPLYGIWGGIVAKAMSSSLYLLIMCMYYKLYIVRIA